MDIIFYIFNAKSKTRQLLVVFDIDETLIHFIPHKYVDLWEQKKSLFAADSYIEKVGADNKKSIKN